MRAADAGPEAPVTVAVSGDPSDEAVLAAAIGLAAGWHATVHLLHSRPRPLHRSDSPEQERAGHAVLEFARRQVLRLAPCRPPTVELVRLPAQEVVARHPGDRLLVLGASRSPHPGLELGLVTRSALYHARSPVAVVHPTDIGTTVAYAERTYAAERNRMQEASVSSRS